MLRQAGSTNLMINVYHLFHYIAHTWMIKQQAEPARSPARRLLPVWLFHAAPATDRNAPGGPLWKHCLCKFIRSACIQSGRAGTPAAHPLFVQVALALGWPHIHSKRFISWFHASVMRPANASFRSGMAPDGAMGRRGSLGDGWTWKQSRGVRSERGLFLFS